MILVEETGVNRSEKTPRLDPSPVGGLAVILPTLFPVDWTGSLPNSRVLRRFRSLLPGLFNGLAES